MVNDSKKGSLRDGSMPIAAISLGNLRVNGLSYTTISSRVFDRFEVVEIEASGGSALGIEVDVRDHEAVEAMVARGAQEWGRIDVLVAMQAAVAVGPWIPRPAPLTPRSLSSR